MKITTHQLEKQPTDFWNRLIYLLSTSPYFGKLGWKFQENLLKLFEKPIFLTIKEKSPNKIRIFTLVLDKLVSEGKGGDDEAEISRALIKFIFALPPNYQRPNPV